MTIQNTLEKFIGMDGTMAPTVIGSLSEEKSTLLRHSTIKLPRVKNQRELLEGLEKDFKLEQHNYFKDMVNYSPRADSPIHRWFKYREGYSVDVIDKLISVNDTKILDPFCGCGTTLVSAKKNGIDAIGIDINPLSAFVAKIKTSNYSNDELELILEKVRTIIESNFHAKIKKPELTILEKAIHPEILDQLLKLKYRINKIKEEKIRDFILLGFLAIIESVSNTFKEGNGIKYRFTKRTKNGYKKIPVEKWYEKNLPIDKIAFVNRKLINQINLMVNDVERTKYSNAEIEVIKGDSRRISQYIEKESITLCAFSPPYCNCFDYFEIFKLELWLGGFIKSYADLRKQRKEALRSNTNTKLSSYCKKFDFLEKFIKLIDPNKLWNKKLPYLIRGYFTDMEQILREIYGVLKNGGRCVIIVGNSAYGGVLIPTDILLAKIAKDIDFKVDKIIVARHLTTSSQQKKELEPIKEYLRESLLCLKK